MRKMIFLGMLVVFLVSNLACLRSSPVTAPPIDFVAEERKVYAAIDQSSGETYRGFCDVQYLTVEFNPAILAHHLNWYIELKVPKDGSSWDSSQSSGENFQQWPCLCSSSVQTENQFSSPLLVRTRFIFWAVHLYSCFALMQTFPSREYQHVLRKIIYSNKTPLALYREEALEALARTGEVTDELWRLLESPDWIERNDGRFHRAIVKNLAYDLALKSDEAGLQCLIEEAQGNGLRTSLLGEVEGYVKPLLNTLAILRDEPSLERKLIYLFEFLVIPKTFGVRATAAGRCWPFYELKIFSELWFQNIETGTQILDRYTQQKPQLRMDFLRLVKDFNIPFMMGKDEEAELYQRVRKTGGKWLPLNMPGIPRLKAKPLAQNQQI